MYKLPLGWLAVGLLSVLHRWLLLLVHFPLLQVEVSLGHKGGGGDVTGTDLCKGVKMCVGAVVGYGMQHS